MPFGIWARSRAFTSSKDISFSRRISMYKGSAVTPTANAASRAIFIWGLKPSEKAMGIPERTTTRSMVRK